MRRTPPPLAANPDPNPNPNPNPNQVRRHLLTLTLTLTVTLSLTLTLTLTRYYGAHFLGACEHDSRCLKAHIGSDNLKLDASSTGVSWWWQTCSQLGFLQRAPKKSYDADPFDAPMRSSEVTP